ncbi:2-keto-4-pentenoate hydratase [Chelatococcus sp. GCM10030263]|uniref:2-keto-4-pentenoate hydratase n=1 Tax=Chelatococcus sp. GCM10030263 TaxID=3273387 RepID=UPI00360E830C
MTDHSPVPPSSAAPAAGDLAGFVAARRRRPEWHLPAAHPQTMAEGYDLQHAIHGALAAAGICRVGYKIGSTSTAGQRALGLSEPIYAGIYDATQAASLHEALAGPLTAPSLECEIAFVMGADLHGGSDLSDDILQGAVQSTHLACEVIDNRYGAPLEVGIPTILTDDFFHAAFVLGPPQANWRDLLTSDRRGATEIDGAVVHGSTADVLRPFEALRWLVQKLAGHGHGLAAGEIVLTGSLVKPTPIRLPAQSVSIRVEGFGALTLAD